MFKKLPVSNPAAAILLSAGISHIMALWEPFARHLPSICQAQDKSFSRKFQPPQLPQHRRSPGRQFIFPQHDGVFGVFTVVLFSGRTAIINILFALDRTADRDIPDCSARSRTFAPCPIKRSRIRIRAGFPSILKNSVRMYKSLSFSPS